MDICLAAGELREAQSNGLGSCITNTQATKADSNRHKFGAQTCLLGFLFQSDLFLLYFCAIRSTQSSPLMRLVRWPRP